MNNLRNYLLDSKALTEAEYELLILLADSARINNAQLASATHTAPSTTLNRVNSMLKSNVIEGFHTRINRKALGLNLQATVSIRLSVQSPEAIQNTLLDMMKIPYITSVMKTTGSFHLIVHAYAQDSDSLQENVIDPISSIPLVDLTETSLLLSHHRRSSLFGDFYAE
ncbi:Lrp/AsnC family transcriptional regulator [Leucobacter sp. UT-8R-CII-1-4]|uniref:Lrp/AsnC family transcriptional regulator n=1 Tax=Leucobacter sp. UT-8R-CII-1-4 TaxID=3040075 RepID=UPI0024A81573|nr:Lrp/AsnC family transcriptional regulator [Leucobacter sp. UT-8R-CII-1-4]MDI6023851.1 Lrp/AsnC family transcriptional regulator [Leucobacter sp. UT-8R-CII-1-4]